MDRKAQTLRQISTASLNGDSSEAGNIARREYPFVPLVSAGRKYSQFDLTLLFMRDGFVDRYSGTRLVFPEALRLLSRLLPEEMPYQSSWKMSECHVMYWELYPTLDHVIPVARGGADKTDNWVTTSMFRNSAKGNALLEEIGWTLRSPGDFAQWDGLLNWFVDYLERDVTQLQYTPLKPWYRAAKRALAISL